MMLMEVDDNDNDTDHNDDDNDKDEDDDNDDKYEHDDNDDNDDDNETCMEELPLLPFVSTTRFGWTGVEPTRVPLITIVMMRMHR